jgi:hypothetical protein
MFCPVSALREAARHYATTTDRGAATTVLVGD